MSDHRMGRRARTVLGLVLLGCWVACGALVPRQGWSPEHGPVVPHDSFPADCSLCHVGDSWHTLKQDFSFDHAAETGVPLIGAHARATCLLCHNDRGPVERYAARGCTGCHIDLHRGQLGPNCDDCHDEQNWIPREVIEHHARTRLPLVGAHAAAACWRCHPGAQVGNFEGLDPTCLYCHTSDLARATSPDHAVQGWVDDCQHCHVSIRWRPARFNHPPNFPLTGGHAGRNCGDCHPGEVFTGQSADCVSCHLTEFQGTTDPNHVLAGFGTDCLQCHNTTRWEGAFFNHPASFPLTGGHNGRSCSECHQGNVFVGAPTDCAGCHLDDFQNTTDPNHAAAGFPTSCDGCHTTLSWLGARFDHSFPINGPHRLSCSDCHLDLNNLMQFSCTHCHDHRQSEMDPKHSEVQNYVFASPNCLDCHPQGRH